MKTKKSAVAPVAPPSVIENSMIPATWQEAFNMLAGRIMNVTRHQRDLIDGLITDLAGARAEARAAVEDLRGLVAAGDKLRGELAAAVDDLTAAKEVQDRTLTATVDSQAEDCSARQALALAVQTAQNDLAAAGDRLDKAVARLEAVEAVAGEVGRQGTVMASRLDDFGVQMADVVQAIATVDANRLHDRAAIDMDVSKIERAAAVLATRMDDEIQVRTVAVDEVRARVEDLSGEDAALSASLDEIGSAVAAVRDTAAATAVRLDGVAATVQTTVDAVGAVRERLDDTSGRVEALTKGHVRESEAVQAIEVRVMELQSIAGRHSVTLDDESNRILQVEQAVQGFVATAANIGREVATITARADGLDKTMADQVEAISDAIRRVTIALGEMPAGFMIDQEGFLSRVNRAGDMTRIGKVVGEARDGRDAPVIVAAKIEDDRLIITMSDRSEISCAMKPLAVEPVAPPPEPLDPTTLGYLSKDPNVRKVQVADMVAMKAAGKRYKEIAAKYGISERQAARLIKENRT